MNAQADNAAEDDDTYSNQIARFVDMGYDNEDLETARQLLNQYNGDFEIALHKVLNSADSATSDAVAASFSTDTGGGGAAAASGGGAAAFEKIPRLSYKDTLSRMTLSDFPNPQRSTRHRLKISRIDKGKWRVAFAASTEHGVTSMIHLAEAFGFGPAGTPPDGRCSGLAAWMAGAFDLLFKGKTINSALVSGRVMYELLQAMHADAVAYTSKLDRDFLKSNDIAIIIARHLGEPEFGENSKQVCIDHKVEYTNGKILQKQVQDDSFKDLLDAAFAKDIKIYAKRAIWGSKPWHESNRKSLFPYGCAATYGCMWANATCSVLLYTCTDGPHMNEWLGGNNYKLLSAPSRRLQFIGSYGPGDTDDCIILVLYEQTQHFEYFSVVQTT